MEAVRMKVKDMDCESCMKRITKKLKSVSGVRDVNEDLKQREVVIKYDNPALWMDDFTCGVEDLGYNKV